MFKNEPVFFDYAPAFLLYKPGFSCASSSLFRSTLKFDLLCKAQPL